MKKIIPILIACTFSGKLVFSQLNTTNTLTPTQLVQDVLVGQGVIISNVTFTGYNNAIGKYTVTGPLTFGIDSGIVLSTGTILAVDPTFGNGVSPHGPNNSGSNGVDNNEPGDPDLAILGGTTSFNAAILEFDFIPSSDTVKFKYVFGSEEYMEFVNAGVNDAFGFFLSGPGITGPFSNNSKNLAVLPDGVTPVTIDDVNQNNNGAYYVNNETPPGQLLQYDGYTVPLTAISHVQCGETYHIKIAICDIGDGVWDSGVFLEAGSFSSAGVEISAITTTGDTVFTEGCTGAIYYFERPTANDTLVINIGVSGTATEGTDFNFVPDSVVLLPGTFLDSIYIDAFADNITESMETVTLFITYNTGCYSDTVSATLYLQDYIPMQLSITGDTTICPQWGESANLNSNVSGGYGGYHFTWIPTQDTTVSIAPIPNYPTQYTLLVSDDCNNTVQSNPILVIPQCPIEIPNVMSGNNDGVNDLFYIKNIEMYPENEVFIYNRWGSLVYYQKAYQNDWDADNLVGGTYFYVVDNKVDKPIAGFLTLIR